ncbi:MAG: hypothetical protein USCGTAYLOR_00468 [Chromatiales bacterium USCg_Taylor]|nr:MAG: hypothetical protein USCGTAYLOR_00468 [Chromatiales bacterium USCg_Taylor]
MMGAGRCGAARRRAVAPAIDVLATSPLVRAVQTAEILAAVYNGRNMVTVKELSPESEFPPFLLWLRTQDAGGTVAIVGHEPHLSGLTSWMLTGRKPSFISLTGAACLLEWIRKLASQRWNRNKGSLSVDRCHESMKITNAEFDASTKDLTAAMEKLKVPAKEMSEVLHVSVPRARKSYKNLRRKSKNVIPRSAFYEEAI